MAYINIQSIFLSLAWGTVSAYIAKKRGENPWIWFFLGIFFGGLGLFAIFLWPQDPKKKAEQKAKKNDEVKKKAPPVFDITPSDANRLWYYLDSKRDPVGPLPFTALQERLYRGLIERNTLIWHEGLKDWISLSEILQKEINN
jgi:hypothetical protein